jgi:hypothetical protein
MWKIFSRLNILMRRHTDTDTDNMAVSYVSFLGAFILQRVDSLLCKDRGISKYTRVNSKQRLGKHVPVATNTHAIVDVLLEMAFITGSVPRGYKEENWSNQVRDSRVEAGSNTSSVALRVEGGDEREPSILRQLNMIVSLTGLGPENGCAGDGQQQL